MTAFAPVLPPVRDNRPGDKYVRPHRICVFNKGMRSVLTQGTVTTYDFPTVLELNGILRQLKLGTEIWCKQRHEDLLTRIAAGRWKIVGKLTADIPIGARQRLDDEIKTFSDSERCEHCLGCPPDRLCSCKGMQAIPGVDHDSLHAFCLASQKFCVAKPWLHMRINHIFAVAATNCEYKVHILHVLEQREINLPIYCSELPL